MKIIATIIGPIKKYAGESRSINQSTKTLLKSWSNTGLGYEIV